MRIHFEGRCFSLIELMVVIAIIMILASLLFPALKSAREFGKAAVCVGNQKQLYLGWQYYSLDHQFLLPIWASVDRFVPDGSDRIGCWPSVVSEYLGMDGITDGYWDYVPAKYRYGTVFSCPSLTADLGKNSKTMWGYVWEAHYGIPWYNMGGFDYKTYVAYKRPSEIKRPASKIVFVDTYSGPGYSGNIRIDQMYLTTTYISYRHSNRCGGLYADGHAERFNRTDAISYAPWNKSPMWGWDD